MSRLRPVPVGDVRPGLVPLLVGGRRGFGDLSSYGSASLNDYATTFSGAGNGVLQSVLSGMPPDVIQAMNHGSGVIRNAGPALDLAGTISSGGVPSEQEIVAGMAAVAGMVNPAAGAIMAAGGELLIGAMSAMQAIFSALGLYSPPEPSWAYIGLLRAGSGGDSIPYPPSATTGTKDPSWLSFADYLSLLNFINCGRPAPVADVTHPMPPYSPNAQTPMSNQFFINLYELALIRSKPFDNSILAQIGSYTSDGPCYGPVNYSSCPKYLPCKPDANGNCACPWCTEKNGGVASYSYASQFSPSPFEIYFNILLCKNLEYWANGNPFVPVRTLLAAAVSAWNSTHTSGSQVCYQPQNLDADAHQMKLTAAQYGGNGPPGSGSIDVYIASTLTPSTVSWVLGPNGGYTDTITPVASDQPAVCVNSGDFTGSATSTKVSSGSALATAAVVAPVGIVGGATVGALAYSFATGQAFETVVKAAWEKILDFATTFGR